jgi:hypothetical protein
MNAEDLAKKEPMATPGFTILTPKAEAEHAKKFLEEQERQMTDCCGDGYRPYDYDRYGYKPCPQNPSQDASALPAEQEEVLQTNKKNSKR